eukprot:6193565-Pleurochrysis_carterae.AAC.1
MSQLKDFCSAHATTTDYSKTPQQVSKGSGGRLVTCPWELMLLRATAATPHRTRTAAAISLRALLVGSQGEGHV